jgi:hypothetical protein
MDHRVKPGGDEMKGFARRLRFRSTISNSRHTNLIAVIPDCRISGNPQKQKFASPLGERPPNERSERGG